MFISVLCIGIEIKFKYKMLVSASVDFFYIGHKLEKRKNEVPEICGQKYMFSTYVVLHKETACNVIVKENLSQVH